MHAELAGIDPDEIGLEIQGRELVIAGHRRPSDAEGRVYQQLEIDLGPFRRTIPLGADVVADQAKATYGDGILRIELPLAQPRRAHGPMSSPRIGDRETMIDIQASAGEGHDVEIGGRRRSPRRCRSCRCARPSRCPTR